QVCSSCRSRPNPYRISSTGPSIRISASEPIARVVERCQFRSTIVISVSIRFPDTPAAPEPEQVLVLGRVPVRAGEQVPVSDLVQVRVLERARVLAPASGPEPPPARVPVRRGAGEGRGGA